MDLISMIKKLFAPTMCCAMCGGKLFRKAGLIKSGYVLCTNCGSLYLYGISGVNAALELNLANECTDELKRLKVEYEKEGGDEIED